MHVFQSKVPHYVLLHVSSLWSGVFSVSQLDGLMFENEEIETAIKINIGQIVQEKKTVNFFPKSCCSIIIDVSEVPKFWRVLNIIKCRCVFTIC